MKIFERLVKNYICTSIPVTLDPLQFAYRPNISTDDAISLTMPHISARPQLSDGRQGRAMRPSCAEPHLHSLDAPTRRLGKRLQRFTRWLCSREAESRPASSLASILTSSLDYCNDLLGGCNARLINTLQMVQNAAARVLTRTRKYDHISPVMSTLHWLPI